MGQALGVVPGSRGTGTGLEASSTEDAVACVPLLVEGLSVNAEYDPDSADFRLAAWLADAGLITITPAARERMQAAHTAAAESHRVAVTTATSSSSRAKGPTSSSSRAEGPNSSFFRAEGRRSRGAGAGSSDSEAGARTPPSSAAAAGTRAPKTKRDLLALLASADATAGFTADLRLGPTLSVILPDGTLHLPSEVRDALGSSLHITGAFGENCLREWAEEVGGDVDWALSGGRGGSRGDETEEERPSRVPRGYEPGVVQFFADHLSAEAKLYRQTGLLSRGPTLLHEPATIAIDYNPGLFRFALQAINPLLSRSVAVDGFGVAPDKGATAWSTRASATKTGAQAVRVSFAPEGLSLPFESAIVEIEPLQLTLASGGLIEELCWAIGIGSTAVRQGKLQVQTSKTQVRVQLGGAIATNRVDMLIGSGSRDSPTTLELSLWGTHNVPTGALDFVVGLPSGALRGLGIRALPEGYVLPVEMRGTLARPAINYKHRQEP
ncbi:hypothetical protein FOA52_005421 [Chlamydomonas sp. UWO 241]|nr:hypothetical protein FOA52_005421 [Chlamydomonas sp. UWO 241]